MPFSPLRLLLFVLTLAVLIILVQIGLVSIAFDKLGLSPESAYLLLLCTLVGSLINLPLFTLKADPSVPVKTPPEWLRNPFFRLSAESGKIMVFANVGGAVVPVAFSLYLIVHNPVSLLQIGAGVAGVAFIVRAISRPVPGTGIAMPMLFAPFAAALIATLIDPEQRAPLAYISGTLGVLIGADLLHLNDIRRLGSPIASIGGAGTFDGVYITGFLAVLLA